MTTRFNQPAAAGNGVSDTVIIPWLNFTMPRAAAPVKSIFPTIRRATVRSGAPAMKSSRHWILAGHGGEVVLPEGVFLINQPVVLRRSHQTLCGAGDATILRLVADANCPVIIMGEPVNHPNTR